MPKQKMRTVEYFRCWDGGKWDTDLIKIPAGTPADKIEDAIRKAVAKAFKAENAPAFVGLYNSNDDGEE